MKETNARYNQALQDGDRNYEIRMLITDNEGNVIATLDNDNLTTFSYKDACISKGNFALGGTYAKNISFTIANFDGAYDNLDFGDEKLIELSIVLDQFVMPFGNYVTYSQKIEGNCINVEAADYMILFNIPFKQVDDWSEYSSVTDITCGWVVNAICNHVGIEVGSPSFAGYNEAFDLDTEHLVNFLEMNPSCRDAIGYVAELACGFARIGADNKLYIYSFPDLANYTETFVNGGSFDGTSTPYEDGDSKNGGSFDGTSTPYADGDSVNGGDFDISYHLLDKSNEYTQLGARVFRYDGMLLSDNATDRTTEMTDLASFSECTNVLNIKNPFLPLWNAPRANRLWSSIKTFSFMPYSGDYLSDLSREAGDKVVFFDYRNVAHNSLILSYAWSYGDMEQVSANAEESANITIN